MTASDADEIRFRPFRNANSILQEPGLTDAASLDRFVADCPLPNRTMLLHLAGLAASGEPKVQSIATGLLKRYQKRGVVFDSEIVERLLNLLPSTVAWETVLHILQMLPGLAIPREEADSLCDALRDLSRHRNKFVRAWAYSGLHHLATEFPEYRGDVLPLLERALHEEPASVRARLRQLAPLGPPTKRPSSRRG